MPSLLELNRDLLAAIRALQMGSCCPDNTTLFGDEIDTDLTPGIGDPPATWGDTQEVANWDEWFNLLCAASDRYVDYLIRSAQEAQKLINQAAITISIIAAILALMSGAGILIAISYTSAAAAFNSIVAFIGTQAFEDAADRFEANRDYIICAIKEDNLRSAMELVLGPLLWTFYRYTQWENATNILWEGGVPGGEQLAPVTGIACPDCENVFPPLPPEEPSGLYFWSDNASKIRDYETLNTLRNQEIYYYRQYKIFGDQAGRLRFLIHSQTNGAGSKIQLLVRITPAVRGSGGSSCGEHLQWYDTNGNVTKFVLDPDWDGYIGQDPAYEVRCGCMQWPDGHMTMYLIPIT